jgi:hypothetical protein
LNCPISYLGNVNLNNCLNRLKLQNCSDFQLQMSLFMSIKAFWLEVFASKTEHLRCCGKIGFSPKGLMQIGVKLIAPICVGHNKSLTSILPHPHRCGSATVLLWKILLSRPGDYKRRCTLTTGVRQIL